MLCTTKQNAEPASPKDAEELALVPWKETRGMKNSRARRRRMPNFIELPKFAFLLVRKAH